MKKAQLSIYLDPETFASLEAFAKRHGKPKSLVAEAAIASFLSPDDSDRREAAIAKRLDRIVRVLERLERNDMVTLETIALFIRFWLTSTPALPEHSSPAARAKGAERYDRFVEALGRRLSSGSTMLKEVSIESYDAENTVRGKDDAGARANQPANPFFRYARTRSPSPTVASMHDAALLSSPSASITPWQNPSHRNRCGVDRWCSENGEQRKMQLHGEVDLETSQAAAVPTAHKRNSSVNPQSNHPDHRETSPSNSKLRLTARRWQEHGRGGSACVFYESAAFCRESGTAEF